MAVILPQKKSKMTISNFYKLTLIILFTKSYSQEKYIVKYENGKTKIEGFVKENILDSIYKEYYENGNLKTEGNYKNCEYKTNRKGIYIVGCEVGKEKDNIATGKRHGTWKSYSENGILSETSNFHCNIMQGNFSSFNKDGKLQTKEFYNEGKLMNSQEFNENGILVETSNYKYEEGKPESFKKVHTFEFYENGDLKSENITEENNETEIEDYKEYYKNGFLKIEKYTINGNKNKIYREYFENGNVKYEGLFKDNIPIKKQYFNNENGTLLKTEVWKNDKIIKTETK